MGNLGSTGKLVKGVLSKYKSRIQGRFKLENSAMGPRTYIVFVYQNKQLTTLKHLRHAKI